MKIKIIAVGKNMPDWVNIGSENYLKRLLHQFKFELIEIPLTKRPKNCHLQRIQESEYSQMLSHITNDDFVVALDENGKCFSSIKFAEQFNHWQQQAKTLVFLIGGPEGFTDKIYQRANQLLSLSDLTFPHPLVRIVLLEQIYRAWSINSGHPYHRD